MDEFVIWLLAQMERRGWTQRELARRAGLSHSTINFILNGRYTPKTATLVAIAQALTVPVSEVLQAAGVDWGTQARYDKVTWEIAQRSASLPEELRRYLLEVVRHLQDVAGEA